MTNDTKKQIIDASGQSLGRLASQVAKILMGKHKASYVPYKVTGDEVVLENISQIKVSEKKLNQRKYYHYSGYPGGMKVKKAKDIFQKSPADLFRRAVSYMLPKNNLRKLMMKRLIIK